MKKGGFAVRILVIEDDAALCRVLEAGLRDAGIAADFCRDGADGLQLLRQNCYDACCLDRMLPGLDGLTVLRRARAGGLATPVLMLTALDRLDDRVEGLNAGADDYLPKPFAMRELVARLNALTRRPAAAPAAGALCCADLRLEPDTAILRGPAGSCVLSPKECALLEAFLRYPTQLFTRDRLLARVWGGETDIEESTLNTYICFLRRKLKKLGSRLTVQTVYGVGYRLEGMP